MVNFDGDPTADSEQYNKLDRSIRDELESQVIFFHMFSSMNLHASSDAINMLSILWLFVVFRCMSELNIFLK